MHGNLQLPPQGFGDKATLFNLSLSLHSLAFDGLSMHDTPEIVWRYVL